MSSAAEITASSSVGRDGRDNRRVYAETIEWILSETKDNRIHVLGTSAAIWQHRRRQRRLHGAMHPDGRPLAQRIRRGSDSLFGVELSLVSRLGGHSMPRTHRGKERVPVMMIIFGLMKEFEAIAESWAARGTC